MRSRRYLTSPYAPCPLPLVLPVGGARSHPGAARGGPAPGLRWPRAGPPGLGHRSHATQASDTLAAVRGPWVSQAATVFVTYLSSGAHETLVWQKETTEEMRRVEKRRRVGGGSSAYDDSLPKPPAEVKIIDGKGVLMAARLMMPEISPELENFAQNFDPKKCGKEKTACSFRCVCPEPVLASHLGFQTGKLT